LKKAEDAAADVREQIVETVTDVKEAAAGAADAVTDVMTAATAAMTNTMIVQFQDSKGTTKDVHFKTQSLGFSCARSGGGCSCMSAPKQQQVLVRSVDGKSEAQSQGVQRGWVVKAINGVDITAGLEEANKLLAEGKANLPQA